MKCRSMKWILGLGLLGLGVASLGGCQHSAAGHGRVVRDERVVIAEPRTQPGPPDHAPAHGWRRKHGIQHHTQSHKRPQGEPRVEVELVYDGDLGVYVVVGHAGVYFHASRYYRLGDSSWEWSGQVAGSWTIAPDHGVPTGLRDLGPEKSPKVTKRKRSPKKPARSHPAKQAY